MRRMMALPLLATLTACGPVFFVEAEIPRVCKTFGPQSMPAAPTAASADLTFPSMSFDFGTDLTGILEQEGLETQLRLTGAQLIAGAGVDNLDFIEAAVLRLLPPAGSSLEPLVVVDYHRAAGAPSSTSIELGQLDLMDVLGYVESGQFSSELTLSGSLPTADWEMDVKPCLYAKGMYQYL